MTEEFSNLEREVIGYMLNTELSDNAKRAVYKLQKNLSDEFKDLVWIAPLDSLHITLMDWVAPLIDYNQDKDVLFDEIYPGYDKSLNESLHEIKPFTVDFSAIEASPGAVFITGTDRGQYADIRNKFLQKENLVEGTKSPPQIIHTSIARFTRKARLKRIKEFLNHQKVLFKQPVDSFRLVRETKVPMLEFKIVKDYQLT